MSTSRYLFDSRRVNKTRTSGISLPLCTIATKRVRQIKLSSCQRVKLPLLFLNLKKKLTKTHSTFQINVKVEVFMYAKILLLVIGSILNYIYAHTRLGSYDQGTIRKLSTRQKLQRDRNRTQTYCYYVNHYWIRPSYGSIIFYH
jgi:hypothetical protein